MEKLIPYTVYLPQSYYDYMKTQAKGRKASSFVREALIAKINGLDLYKSGYNQGLSDAVRAIDDCKEINFINLGDFLAQLIFKLEKE